MPIKIYLTKEEGGEIAWLCDDEWALPPQIEELERWVLARPQNEPIGCIADIGFQWRRDARAGGSALNADILKKMGELDITLFLSEYAGFAGEDG